MHMHGPVCRGDNDAARVLVPELPREVLDILEKGERPPLGAGIAWVRGLAPNPSPDPAPEPETIEERLKRAAAAREAKLQEPQLPFGIGRMMCCVASRK